MSGSKNQPRTILWDSCVFLAWLKEEKDKPLEDLRAFIRDIESEKTILHVSSVAYVEILNLIVPGEPLAATAGSRFRSWVKRPCVEVLNVDPRIAEQAGDLKERSIKIRNDNKKCGALRIPDAIIAATALVYGAEVLHTFDPDMLDLVPFGVFGNLEVKKPFYPEPNRPLLGDMR
jgi:predicted nucleic acid-binding protein